MRHRRYWWDDKFYLTKKGEIMFRVFDAKTDKILYLNFRTFLQIEDWLSKETYNPTHPEDWEGDE